MSEKEENKKFLIAVLSGGMSTERDISLISGKAVEDALRRLSYKVINIDVDSNVASNLKKVSPDLVFNALHGQYGEDGAIAGLLEIMNIPYTHSGIMASSIAMNKSMTKHIMDKLNIDCPKGYIVTKEEVFSDSEIMPYPYVLKPIDSGSSIGVNIIFSHDDYCKALRSDEIYDQMIIEEYIIGQEVQTAILFDRAVGTIEICPKTSFYDYNAKYSEGLAEHIFPARLPKEIYDKTLKQSLKIHKFLGCKTISRCDFRYDSKCKVLKMLEINTHPGFTALSLVPEIVNYVYNIGFDELIDLIVKSSLFKEKNYGEYLDNINQARLLHN